MTSALACGDHLELADGVLRLVNRASLLGEATERFAAWLREHTRRVSTDGQQA